MDKVNDAESFPVDETSPNTKKIYNVNLAIVIIVFIATFIALSDEFVTYVLGSFSGAVDSGMVTSKGAAISSLFVAGTYAVSSMFL
jgi:hypothetical protein